MPLEALGQGHRIEHQQVQGDTAAEQRRSTRAPGQVRLQGIESQQQASKRCQHRQQNPRQGARQHYQQGQHQRRAQDRQLELLRRQYLRGQTDQRQTGHHAQRIAGHCRQVPLHPLLACHQPQGDHQQQLCGHEQRVQDAVVEITQALDRAVRQGSAGQCQRQPEPTHAHSRPAR